MFTEQYWINECLLIHPSIKKCCVLISADYPPNRSSMNHLECAMAALHPELCFKPRLHSQALLLPTLLSFPSFFQGPLVSGPLPLSPWSVILVCRSEWTGDFGLPDSHPGGSEEYQQSQEVTAERKGGRELALSSPPSQTRARSSS